MGKQDKELIFEYQQGKIEAFEALFRKYKARILNFALRILGNRADAEDVTGDVFLTLFQKKDKYEPKAKFSTWLFTIARNFCISRIRKRKRMVSMWFPKTGDSEYEQWDVKDKQPLAPEAIKKEEEALMVKKAIQTLPLAQKEALILREYHSFSYQEIKDILDCSLEQVKILIYRAREALRGELSPFLTEENND